MPEHRRLETGSVSCDDPGRHLGQPLAFDLPGRAAEMIRRVLDVRRHGRVERGELDPRLVREAAVLGGVERALDCIDVAPEPNAARERCGLLARIEHGEAREPRRR